MTNRARCATWRAVVAFVIAAMAVAACGTGTREQAPGAHARAQRIISLVPAVTEMLFAIGAGKQVIAVSSFDHYPPDVETLPRVGALLDPDVERILSMRPDLVALFEGQQDLREKLTKARIAVFSYGRPTLADVPRTMEALGRVTGHERRAAEAVASLQRELQQTADRGATRGSEGTGRLRVMLVIGREPGTLRNIYVSGGEGFLADLLRLVGGSGVLNVFDGVRRENLQVTTEAILAAQPDVIIEVVASRPWSAELISREEHVWDELSALPAVRTHRVHLLVGDEFVIPGPRVVQAARELAAIVK
jgi:iron complex transport system substrate-binding protein